MILPARLLVPTMAAVLAAAPLSAAQPPTPATRADLARAYLRLEQAIAAHPLPPERTAERNRAFDQATLAFFGGGFSAALQGVAQLTDAIEHDDHPSPAAAFASSLTIRIDPPVAPLASPVRITVEPLYPTQTAPGVRLVIDNGPDSVLADEPITALPFASTFDPKRIGTECTLRLRLVAGSATVMTASLPFVARPLSESRARLLDRLAAVRPAPALEASLAACRARIDLLQDRPSQTESSQFLADPIPLHADLEREVAALAAGTDPYRRRAGDIWRPIHAAGLDVPCRLYAPPITCDDQPHPLVIALHGAGGDESMFFEGYGAGRIKALADRHGFIVLAPLTYMTMGSGAVFDGLVQTVSTLYSVDPNRIYIIGHSMGAGAAAGLAVQRADRLAAVCCIAGTGRFTPAKPPPPILIFAGSLDPLIPASRIKPAADAAAKAGLPVELRTVENAGHTLLVTATLDDAVEWLLTRRRP